MLEEQKMSKHESSGKKPLAGVRVLDCSWATGGPYGTLLLALLGAEVIKIETPPTVTGVSTRQMLFPQYSHEGDDVHFLTYNRNKKSMVIDLRSDQGREVFHDLVKKSDVVFDNFRPGVVNRLGIDYETLREINPRIICSSLSGFGATGPDKGKAAFDTIIEASSGITSLLSQLLPPDTVPPCYPGISWADHVGGLGAAFAVVVALYARESSGEGQRLDVSMQDMLISMTGNLLTAVANFESFEDPLPKMLWGTFKTKDDYVVLCGHREGMWLRLCKSLGHAEWITDPRFDSHPKRIEHGEELYSMVEEILLTKTTRQWLEIFTEGDVPATRINSVKDVINSPQTSARNMLPGFDHKGKEIRAPGNPFKMSGLEETFQSPPDLGEHTQEMLSEVLDYSSEKIAELRKTNVVA
jgi:crotonobetainyl-CoA:carnitine CoA-transferase CaiB-like acyl-CoA transferase